MSSTTRKVVPLKPDISKKRRYRNKNVKTDVQPYKWGLEVTTTSNTGCKEEKRI